MEDASDLNYDMLNESELQLLLLFIKKAMS